LRSSETAGLIAKSIYATEEEVKKLQDEKKT
jgi:hypothetical protein